MADLVADRPAGTGGGEVPCIVCHRRHDGIEILWARRHRNAVAGLAAIIGVLVIASSVSALAILNAYLRGEAEVMVEMIVQQTKDGNLTKKLLDRLVHVRNRKMAETISGWMQANEDKSLFVAVGAGHMAGETGLVTLLTKGGHEVERLDLDDTAKVKAALGSAKKEPVGAGAGG